MSVKSDFRIKKQGENMQKSNQVSSVNVNTNPSTNILYLCNCNSDV